MPFVRVNDANFYYELHGKGQPVVLIAGYTCDSQYWLPVIEELSQYFQVLIFDNRGSGQTEDNGGSLSAELMARDVMAITEKLQLKKPHIVGQSMGGAVAQCVASQYPKEINKLVLLVTTAKWRQATIRSIEALLALRKQEINFDLIFELTISWIYGEHFLKNQTKVQQLKEAWLKNPHPQSYLNQARQVEVIKKYDGHSQLKNIQAETLIAYGLEDLLVLPAEAQHLAKHITRAELVEFNCGHDFSNEAPNQLAKVLIDYLKK